ncbi:electron transfer flavoprotein subunit beta/FixA family protein [Desulfosarcina ovata]|uniref:Electron transfer flavoprotein subunit beta n=1 Tax=Desulfosarcina ovata subsp. ovata TaxID=2752305 RepID=A0A5K8AFZ8_9BACT|nr:electron transfer flavoprotein subunit beta/FixA family protein [Desulfosarcina ovata]BBO91541.1 electron transfer flavoprotein subunit beta [Desulfosarcina ovata subsp. ovata]
MEIVVLVKQVPDTNAPAEVAGAALSGEPADIPWTINPHDEMAVEEALRVKEAHGGRVTLLSFSRPEEFDALRIGIAMGADRAVAIIDELKSTSRYRDGLLLSRIFAAALKTMRFDLIIAGQKAVDDDAGVVGPALAEKLNLPFFSMVVGQEISGNRVRCKRLVGGGRMEVEAPLPALLLATRGLNRPRYATMPGLRRATRQGVETWRLRDIAPDAQHLFCDQPSRLIALEPVESQRDLTMARGDSPREKAEALARYLLSDQG